MRKIITYSVAIMLLCTSHSFSDSSGNESLNSSSNPSSANECFEGVSRAMFSFNQAVDMAVFEPIAKGYRAVEL